MSRRIVSVSCEGNNLLGTLDTSSSSTGLLIVSGGNEIRSGPWGSQALLAKAIAAAGFPVFRFDRRGVGDSDGPNGGYRSAAPDIAAALSAFRAHVPALRRVVGYGNCDGASALMLASGGGCDGLVLANPWTIDEMRSGEAPDGNAALPSAAVRAHYLRRLRDPGALLRLVKGKVSLAQLVGSLRDAARPAPPPSTLARELAQKLGEFAGPTAILLAERDRTAQEFLTHWDKRDARLRICPQASHSFVEPSAQAWLREQLVAALRD